jgi:hypothetical protein
MAARCTARTGVYVCKICASSPRRSSSRRDASPLKTFLFLPRSGRIVARRTSLVGTEKERHHDDDGDDGPRSVIPEEQSARSRYQLSMLYVRSLNGQICLRIRVVASPPERYYLLPSCGPAHHIITVWHTTMAPPQQRRFTLGSCPIANFHCARRHTHYVVWCEVHSHTTRN